MALPPLYPLEYRPKSLVQRKQHLEFFWEMVNKGSRVTHTNFKDIKAGDWLQFKWRSGGTHSVIFIRWVSGNKNSKVREAETMSAGAVWVGGKKKNLPGWYGHHKPKPGRDNYTLTYLWNQEGELVYNIFRPKLRRPKRKAAATQ